MRTLLALDWMQRQAGSSPLALSRSVARALREESWVQAGDRRELEAILETASGIEESGKGSAVGAHAVRASRQGGGLHRVRPHAGSSAADLRAARDFLRALQRRPLAR